MSKLEIPTRCGAPSSEHNYPPEYLSDSDHHLPLSQFAVGRGRFYRHRRRKVRAVYARLGEIEEALESDEEKLEELEAFFEESGRKGTVQRRLQTVKQHLEAAQNDYGEHINQINSQSDDLQRWSKELTETDDADDLLLRAVHAHLCEIDTEIDDYIRNS